MTNQEIIAGLTVHIDMSHDCDRCPFNGDPMCFEKLIMEACARLEEKGDQT